MRLLLLISKAFAPAACLGLLLACPRAGSAQTNTCSVTPTATATATPSPTAVPAKTKPAGQLPRGHFLFLSANVVRHVETAPLMVRVHLPDPDSIVIKLFNVAGEELRAERAGPAADFTWVWDGTAGGEVVSPGVYLVSAATDRGGMDLRRFVLER